MEVNKILENQSTKYVIIGIAAVVGLSIVYFGIINPLLKAANLKDDEIDKKALQLLNSARTQEWWKPTYMQGRENQISFTNKGSDSSEIAKSIYDSFSWTGDNESKINAMLSRISTKADLSYVVWQYQNIYNKDLLTELYERLSHKEFILAMGKVQNLKTFA